MARMAVLVLLAAAVSSVSACVKVQDRNFATNTKALNDCLEVVVTTGGSYVIDLYAITGDIDVEMRGSGVVTFVSLASHNKDLKVTGSGSGRVHFPKLVDQKNVGGGDPARVSLRSKGLVVFDVLDKPEAEFTCNGEGVYRFPGLKTLETKFKVRQGTADLPVLSSSTGRIDVDVGSDETATINLGSAASTSVTSLNQVYISSTDDATANVNIVGKNCATITKLSVDQEKKGRVAVQLHNIGDVGSYSVEAAEGYLSMTLNGAPFRGVKNCEAEEARSTTTPTSTTPTSTTPTSTTPTTTTPTSTTPTTTTPTSTTPTTTTPTTTTPTTTTPATATSDDSGTTFQSVAPTQAPTQAPTTKPTAVTFWLDIDFFTQDIADLSSHTETMFTQQVQLRETDILTVSIVPGSVKVTSLLASEAAASAFLALLPSGTLTVDGHPVLAERPVPGIAEGSGGDDGGASGAGVSASLLGAVIAAAIGGFVLALVLVMFVKRRSSRRSVSPPPPPKYSEATTARSLKALGSPPKYDEARAADQVTYEEAMGGVNEYEYLPDGETLYEIPADGPPQMAKTQHTAQMQRATRTQAHHAQARQVAAPGAQRGATYDMATGYGAGPAAYEAALASDGALYDSATSDEAAVYDTATPGSAAVYDSATPGSAAVYDSATPDNSAAVYDSATPDNSAATYDVASPSARQPEYSVASSARQPAEESYDNLGHDGHTLYDVVPSNRQDQVINFGFRKMSDQDA